MTKIVAFLPAKGTSSRIENKNTKLLDGKELFMHTLQKLMNCDFIDEVHLDSESKDIFKIASEVPCKKIVRKVSLADNKTGFQINPDSKKEFIKKIVFFYKNREELKKMGNYGRNRVKNKYYNKKNKNFANYLRRL
tara:strand:+ start:210 stop:617 length:408 start_codon:yes stop_codon:yes gene_type:complete